MRDLRELIHSQKMMREQLARLYEEMLQSDPTERIVNQAKLDLLNALLKELEE